MKHATWRQQMKVLSTWVYEPEHHQRNIKNTSKALPWWQNVINFMRGKGMRKTWIPSKHVSEMKPEIMNSRWTNLSNQEYKHDETTGTPYDPRWALDSVKLIQKKTSLRKTSSRKTIFMSLTYWPGTFDRNSWEKDNFRRPTLLTRLGRLRAQSGLFDICWRPYSLISLR